MIGHTQERLLTYFTPALLIAIALLQMYTAHTQGLTPWKGGGFGMFSTVDSGGARFFRIYMDSSEAESVSVDMPNTKAYGRLKSKIRRLPQQGLMAQLAANLADETWVSTEYSAFQQAAQPTETNKKSDDKPGYRVSYEGEPVPANEQIDVQRIRIELWRYSFDGQSGLVEAQKWKEFVYQAK